MSGFGEFQTKTRASKESAPSLSKTGSASVLPALSDVSQRSRPARAGGTPALPGWSLLSNLTAFHLRQIVGVAFQVSGLTRADSPLVLETDPQLIVLLAQLGAVVREKIWCALESALEASGHEDYAIAARSEQQPAPPEVSRHAPGRIAILRGQPFIERLRKEALRAAARKGSRET